MGVGIDALFEAVAGAVVAEWCAKGYVSSSDEAREHVADTFLTHFPFHAMSGSVSAKGACKFRLAKDDAVQFCQSHLDVTVDLAAVFETHGGASNENHDGSSKKKVRGRTSAQKTAARQKKIWQ